ncbi:MAG: hydantoinase B/oxoprolinase family protein [Alphaproteobacteria bacterium]|nr:hydantoinase B/oxoprolinase family protein [Alphaproteobacteria bacterium]
MKKLDPVTIEVVGNHLISTVREMGTTVMRTAYSTIMREQMDCTTALFDPQGQLIAQADHVPSHQGTLSHAAKHVGRRFQLKPGDVVIMNHPYQGGTHHPDIMVFKPVFHDGVQVAMAACLGHHLDVGGRSPGSVATDARDVFEEGLIIPPMKLYKEGRLVEEVFAMIEANIRVPKKTMGDIRAEIAAINVGERRVMELCRKYGGAGLTEIIAGLLDHSERLIRGDLSALPNGRYDAEGFMDSDGIADEPVRIAVAVTLEDGSVTVDFTGSSPQVRGPFNCSLSSVQAAVYCAVRYMVNPAIMQNEGCYRPVSIVLPPRSVVSPEAPAPLSGRFHTMERIATTIVLAFNKARGVDAVGANHAHLASFSASGTYPGTSEPWVLFEVNGGGWGGTRHGDGIDATFGLMANCYDTPVEALELDYPLRVERYEFVTDSGGPGQFRGGLGLRREVRYLSGEGYFTNRSEAQKFPAVGTRGGEPSLPSRQALLHADGTRDTLPSKITNLTIRAGDIVSMVTAGGGGYGDPRIREPDLVLADVLDGKVSAQAARERYGVVLVRDGTKVDTSATRALRANLGSTKQD